MLIATNNDARTALGQLTTDLSATYALVPTINSMFLTSDLQSSALSLLDGINNYAQKVFGELTPTDDPLTAQELAQMKEIQREVIDARTTVQNTISGVSWTFGGIFSDSVTAAENIATTAATDVATEVTSVTGINWTYVIWGLGIVLAIFLFVEFKEYF